MSRYTLVVGTRSWSSWSLRPFVALKATDAAFEIVDIRLRQTEHHPTTKEQILKHSPAGKVPILKIEDGGNTLTVWDSLAICEALADRHPQAQLWPSDPARRAIARSYASEMHSGFPDVRDQLTMEFARQLPTPDLRDATKTQIARILKIWTDALAKHGGPYLFGRFSIADCMYAPVCSRFRTYGIEMPDAAKTYVDRIFALPAMIDWGKAAQKEIADGVA